MNKKKSICQRNVVLYRNGTVLSSLLSSFGSDLKETRLTASLGYLISLTPESFNHLFQIKETITSISVEEEEENGRVDIKIRTEANEIDIEAKINTIDPIDQAMGYKGNKKILLTNYIPLAKQNKKGNIIYCNWSDVYQVLKQISKRGDYRVKFLANDLIKYLIDHDMIKGQKPVEIYLRELNDEVTVNMFLKANFYCCDYVASSDLYKAIYFGPHFGKGIASKHAGIENGVSYIARIERLEVVGNWAHFNKVLQEIRGKNWVKKYEQLLRALRTEWEWNNTKRIVFFLANPIHVFNPPIKKSNLQAGSGWLSKAFLSFDDLFKARTDKIFAEGNKKSTKKKKKEKDRRTTKEKR